MTLQPSSVRVAARIYRAALRLSRRPVVVLRRHEMAQSFVDACHEAEQRHGIVGVARCFVSEIADLVRVTAAPAASRTQIFDRRLAPAAQPRGSRGFSTDIRHAFRALSARRLDTALTVGLLALGLATTSSVFAVTDALIINPTPFPHSDRLVQVWSTINKNSVLSMPRELAVRWLDRTDLFSSGGGYAQTSALVTSGGDPEVIPAAEVSPGLFETLGARPMLGRTFDPEEGRAGTNHNVIISAEVWASRFGRAPDVIGRTLRINALDYRVVGVMPADFRFPMSRQRLWVPLDLRNPPPARVNMQITLVARMQAGITRDRLKQEVEAAGPAIAQLATRPWKMGATPHYLDQILMSTETRRSIWLLFGATVLLMLTVCANVANLGLSQAFGRVRDAAIRSALGASRWRMIRQTMAEQLMVGALALAVALPITYGAIRLADGLLPLSYTISSLNPLNLDIRLIAMMIALALAAPLFAGLVPAIAGSRPSVITALKQESRSVTGSRAARWFRKSLVVLEVACSVVLLVSAALLVRSFIRLQSVEKGFDSRDLVSINLGFPTTYFADGTARDLYLDQAVQRLRQIPGAKAATAATGVPPENGGITFGNVLAEGASQPAVDLVASDYTVRTDFFATMGMPIRAGRNFADGDGPNARVISDSLAAKLWPGQSAVGRRFRWDDGQWNDVIGVVSAVREGVSGSEVWPQIYQLSQKRVPATGPVRDAIPEWKRIAVRVSDSASAIPQIRAILKDVNAGIVVQGVDRVEDQIARDLDRPRFLLVLMLVFAAAGLLLAGVGVYGVLSCLVAEQLREYGIRLMLGASPTRISRQILLGGLATTVVGLFIGAAAAAALGKTINSVLFQVDAHDIVSYVIVAAVLVTAAVAAAWRPARRARNVDPALLLRND